MSGIWGDKSLDSCSKNIVQERDFAYAHINNFFLVKDNKKEQYQTSNNNPICSMKLDVVTKNTILIKYYGMGKIPFNIHLCAHIKK